MGDRDHLTAIWPPYGLVLRTPRLELRMPAERDIVELARVAASGIQRPGEPPFQAGWLYEPSPRVERALLQSIYRDIANWTPEDWSLPLVALREGRPIGLQHIFSRHFRQTRGFGSGVWLGLGYQGQGFGTEMGRAVLRLGFDGLGGRAAYIGAWADNAASIRVMEKLGYLPNGQYYQLSDGQGRLDRRMRLPRENWDSARHSDIAIEGLAPCLELFGAGRPDPPL
jgi:RimJ/RimL family protein N-acetyltransferase